MSDPPLVELQTLTGHTDRIWTLSWNPQGTILASSGSDKSVRLWAQKDGTWTCVTILTGSHLKSIRRVCWSPCGKYIATASFDATVCIWGQNKDNKTWTTVVNLEGHENEVKSVAWSRDGFYLATCGRDRTIWIWEKTEEVSGETEDSLSESMNWDCSDVKNDHTKDVKNIIWHPTFNILVSCSYDDTIKFFHKVGDDWKCCQTLTSHSSTVWSASFSPCGEYLATGSDDKTVRIWKNQMHSQLPCLEPNSWKCVSVIQGYHTRTIYDISWSAIDDVIASVSGDNSIVLCKRDSTHSTDEIFACNYRCNQAHCCDINCVDWNPKVPNLLASGGDDRKIKLWSLDSSKTGMQPKTVLQELRESFYRLATINVLKGSNLTTKTLTITDFPQLLKLIDNLQNLQSELYQKVGMKQLSKLFDIEIVQDNPNPLLLQDISSSKVGDTVEGFTIALMDAQGEISDQFRFLVDSANFSLSLPHRSSGIIAVNSELFLVDRTGDLFKIMPDGSHEFLLGHLFMLSDIKFIVDPREGIKFIITTSRDEKIRVSNYPNTHSIEQFCFGHRHYVESIVVVDTNRFISVDKEDEVCLWNLSLSKKDQIMMPEKKSSLKQETYKRKKTSLSEHSTVNQPDF